MHLNLFPANFPFTHSSSSTLLLDEHRPHFPAASKVTMGKSDEKQTKKRTHKATDGKSKHKKQPSLDAMALRSSDNEGTRHSQWRDHFTNKCLNSRYNSATASCQPNILLTARSGGGLRSSATTTSCSRKESQVSRQLSIFEHWLLMVSTGGHAILIGAYDFNNCANTRRNSATASCHNSTLQIPSSALGL